MEVEDGSVALPTLGEAYNGVEVSALVGMLFLDDLAKDWLELEQEIGASRCSEVE